VFECVHARYVCLLRLHHAPRGVVAVLICLSNDSYPSIMQKFGVDVLAGWQRKTLDELEIMHVSSLGTLTSRCLLQDVCFSGW
jgi:hypothetical protein